MAVEKFLLLILSIIASTTAFHQLYYEYHLQCDENERNPKSSVCTFSDAKGDQKTVWHYQPAYEARYSINIVPTNIRKVVFTQCTLPEIPKGLFNYYTNTRIVIAQQAQIVGIYSYTFKNALQLNRLEMPLNNITTLSDKVFGECPLLAYIDLSFNQIQRIEEWAFYGLKNLRTLDLRGNRIMTLHPKLFVILINLEVLILNANELQGIQDQQFQQNRKLSQIDLSHNQMKQLDGKAFEHLTNLTVLNLAHNYLQQFSTEYFVVRKLYLSGNLIEIFYIFNDIDELDLSDNRLKDLNPRPGVKIGKLSIKNNTMTNIANVCSITSLTTLDMSGNPIGPVMDMNTFRDMTQLTSLVLEGCNLQKIPPNAFSNLKNLRTLNIAYNNLGKFEIYWVGMMPHIDNLYLDGNGLSEFDFNAIKHKFTNNSELGLSDNEFSCDYLRQLVAEVKQQKVRLYFNQPYSAGPNVEFIRCFEGAQSKHSPETSATTQQPARLIRCDETQAQGNKCVFTNVEGLQQGENIRYEVTYYDHLQIEYIIFYSSVIREIPLGLFQYFRNVRNLTATNVYIEEIYEYTFSGAVFLSTVDLSNNKIKKLRDHIFIECVSITELVLSNNEIDYISPEAFQGLMNLHSLALDGNQITIIETITFYPLVNLYYIDLSGNKIENLDENLFMKNLHLKEVGLKNNQIRKIPRKIFQYVIEEITLHIEENNIENYNEAIPHVKNIHLGGNKFGTLQVPAGAQELVVQNSNITTIEVPDSAAYDLNELIVSNNSISDISQIGKLVNLQVLDLSSNPIRTLNPEVFSNLKKLKKLSVHECEIIEIYEEIFLYLIELEYFDVSGNPIKKLDLQSIRPCKNLQTLNLEYCELTEILNIELIQTNFQNLKEVYLSNNNWECNYLKQIVDYLKQRGIRVVVKNPVTDGSHYEGIACTLDTQYLPPPPPQPSFPNKNIEEIDDNQVEMLQPGAGGKYIQPGHGGVQPPNQKLPQPGVSQDRTLSGSTSFINGESHTNGGHMYNPYNPGMVQPGLNVPGSSNWGSQTPLNQISPDYQPDHRPPFNPSGPLTHHQLPQEPVGAGSQTVEQVVNPAGQPQVPQSNPCQGGGVTGDVSCPYKGKGSVIIGQGGVVPGGVHQQGGDVPPPDTLSAGVVNCCDELNELRVKVHDLELEIAMIKRRNVEHVEAALTRKGQEIELNLKEMIRQMIEQKQLDAANSVHTYKRFGGA